MATITYDTTSTPSDGDALIYDSASDKMKWASTGFISVLFSEFGDAGGEYTYDSAAVGSYISGSGGSVSGGGFSGQSLTSGKVFGPLDGTSLTITGVEGDIVIVSRPV